MSLEKATLTNRKNIPKINELHYERRQVNAMKIKHPPLSLPLYLHPQLPIRMLNVKATKSWVEKTPDLELREVGELTPARAFTGPTLLRTLLVSPYFLKRPHPIYREQ